MKNKEFDNEQDALKEAKEYLESIYLGCDRRWLEASPEDSYNDPSYRVTVFVREGSNPKATIVLNRGTRTIRGYNVLFEQVLLFKWRR